MLALVLLSKGIVNKEAFITAIGGPNVLIGTVRAEDFASMLDSLVKGMTSPGSRVYPPNKNREHFWSSLVEMIES